jgi:SAM-dependent methyltransferase
MAGDIAVASVTAPSSHDLLELLRVEVAQYYTQKITRHGATPLGVDWSCVPTQEMRFVQLLKLCEFSSPVTLNDIGCGYGALLAFLVKRYPKKKIDYLGVDLSAAMISQAQQLWGKRAYAEFVIAGTRSRVADYSLASGIFNVKLTQSIAMWEQFITTTLADMYATSQRGFAINFLTPLPADRDIIPELYRVSPDVWSAYCENTFAAKVEIIAGYGMREYTLLVRKI